MRGGIKEIGGVHLRGDKPFKDVLEERGYGFGVTKQPEMILGERRMRVSSIQGKISQRRKKNDICAYEIRVPATLHTGIGKAS